MQSRNEGGWDWFLNDAFPSSSHERTNALAGLGTVNKPPPLFGGLGTIALSNPPPKKKPNYLEAWATADFGKELHKAYWKPEEAVAILLGKAPVFCPFEILAANKFEDPIAWEGMRLHEIVRRALEIGDLSLPLRPTMLIDWALEIGLAVPSGLLAIAAQRNLPLLNYPTKLETVVSECSQEIAKLNSEIEHWKGVARSNAAAVEDASSALKAHDTEIIKLKQQLSEAVCRAEQLEPVAVAADERPKSTSGSTREYRTAVKLLFSVVSKYYGYSAAKADWQKTKLQTDLAEFGTQVSEETLMKHLRSGSEEASR